MTLPELQLWQALRGSAMNEVRFRRQHSFGPHVLDFYAPSAKLVVEVDGSAHDIASVAMKDGRRDLWLRAQGLEILRFNATDILDAKRRVDLLETIAAVIGERVG